MKTFFADCLSFLELLGTGLKLLCLFLSIFAILMACVFGIAARQQFSEHRELLEYLSDHGRETQAVITDVDPVRQYGMLTLALDTGSGKTETKFVYKLSLYPKQLTENLRVGQTIRVRYIDIEYPGYLGYQAVLLDGYAALQKSLGITPDLWQLLAIILVIITISPELTFLGFESPSSNKKTKATSPVSESKEELP